MTLSTLLTSLGLTILTALVFWPGLGGGWLFDDYPTIVVNQAVHLRTLTSNNLWQAAFSFVPGNGSRPLAMVSFALDYYFHGSDPAAFKRTSIWLHALIAVVIFALTSRLLTLRYGNSAHIHKGAAVVALIWATHPLQVSTVLYVVQRMQILATLFLALALLAYLIGRERQIKGHQAWPWFLTSLTSFSLAMASKEDAIAFGLYTASLELTLLHFKARSEIIARRWRWGYGVIAALGGIIFLLVLVPHYASFGVPYGGRDFDTYERLLTQLRVLVCYLGQILLPLPESMPFFYDGLQPSRGWWQPPTTLFSGLLLTGLITLAWRWRHQEPLFSLGIAWFFCAHAVTSNVIGLELAFEHRNYFALLGIVLATFALLYRWIAHYRKKLLSILAIVLVVGIGSLGTLRAKTWGDPLVFALTHAEYAGNSARAWENLVNFIWEKAKPEHEQALFSLKITQPKEIIAALPESTFTTMTHALETAATVPHYTISADTNLILLYQMRQGSVPAQVWDRLLRKLRDEAMPWLTPQDINTPVWMLLGNYRSGITPDPECLLEVVDTLLKRFPKQPIHRYIRVGDFILNTWHDPEKAKPYYLQAVKRAAPNDPRISNLFSALQKMGYADLARFLEQQRYSS